MKTLEELKSIHDGGSFDRLVKKVEEAVDGDESLKQELLTEAVLRGFIQKAQKLLAVKDKQSKFGLEFVNLSFRIPKRIRSNVPHPDANLEGRCYFGVVEEETAAKKQRKTDGLDKKRKAADSCLEEKRTKKKRNIIKKHNLDDQLGLKAPKLPQEFKDQIEKLNGTDVTLVIQKELTRTDMDCGQARFSMPRRQVRTYGFLSEEETHILSQKEIQCSLIQSCFETINFEFKMWKMGKTFSYVLIKNSVAYNTRNHLEIGSKVQLWRFQVESQL